MKSFVKPLSLAGCLSLASLGHAQKGELALAPKDQPLAPPRTTEAIRVNKLPVNMVAHWLDPQRFPSLKVEENSLRSWIRSGLSEADAPRLNPPVPAALPAGIESIKAVEAQNLLLVSGTEEAVAGVRKLVAELDNPIPQTEIECQLIVMTPQQLQSLKLDVEPAGTTFTNQPLNRATLRREQWRQMMEMMTRGEVRILHAPRVVATGSLAGGVQTETVSTGPFSLTGATGPVAFDPSKEPLRGTPSLGDSVGLLVTAQPTGDRSVKARIHLSHNQSIVFQAAAGGDSAGPARPLPAATTTGYNLPAPVETGRFFLRHIEGFDTEIETKTNVDGAVAFIGLSPRIFLPQQPQIANVKQWKGKIVVAFFVVRSLHSI
jgi:hypothetical protein